MQATHEYQESYLPPHSVEAEQSVLGAILFNPDAMHRVADMIKAEDFYRGPHKYIFEAITDLYKLGEAIDIITVSEMLNDKDALDAAGGRPYVMDLALAVTTAENIVYYAKIIRNKALLRSLITAGNEIVSSCYETTDAEQAIDNAQAALLKIATATDDPQADLNGRELAKESLKNIQYQIENPNILKGLPTGLKALDSFIGGLQKSKLIILGARPAMGKSGLALNIATHVGINQRKPVLFYSLEMSPGEMMERALISVAGSSTKMDLLRQAANVMPEHFFIIDRPTLTTTKLRASIVKHKLRLGDLGLVIVDYLQLMKGEGNNRAEEISGITRELKLISREFEIPVLCLSQLSRKVEERQDKRPMNSDLRDSGTIEQDADQVMFIYRDEYYNPDSTEKRGVAEIIVSKNRAGRSGSFELLFRADQVKFMDKAVPYAF